MSQIRKDILTGEWVIFASNRNNKPYHFSRKTIVSDNAEKIGCPFCKGNEDQTTDSIYQNGDDGDWSIRVFKNMYPAVSIENFEKKEESFYCCQEGMGRHEVLVDTSSHTFDICDFSEKHLYNVLKTLQYRFSEMEKEDYIKYVQIFKNNGPGAGASIAHSHWQIVGVPVVTQEQERVMNNVTAYKEETGGCILCDMVHHEIEESTRIVTQSENFISFVPYAAKFGFETWIVPKNHVSSFRDFDDEALFDLGKNIKIILNKIKGLREEISFNLCFQDKPKLSSDGSFHWYLRVFPRIGLPAGFELATESYINPVLPEDAAKKLREF